MIFRHVACEGPGYLAEVLDTGKIPYRIIRIDEGMPVPRAVDGASGLVFMGGPMSVNDVLPWIGAELDLIRNAHRCGIPVLGHCLGGQLISKALGGKVMRNPVTEIGWYAMECTGGAVDASWLRELSDGVECFHWHGETFSLPPGATPLFKSRFCQHQGFILGNSLALQCHVEMTAEMVKEWLEYYKHELPAPSSSVQSPEEMVQGLDRRIVSLHDFADKIYGTWLKGFDTAH